MNNHAVEPMNVKRMLERAYSEIGTGQLRVTERALVQSLHQRFLASGDRSETMSSKQKALIQQIWQRLPMEANQ